MVGIDLSYLYILVAFNTNFVTNMHGNSTAVLPNLGAVEVVLRSVSCISMRLSCPWEYENTNCTCMLHISCVTAGDNGVVGTDTYIFSLCHLSLQIDFRWSQFICEICPLEQQSSFSIICSVHHGRNVSGIFVKKYSLTTAPCKRTVNRGVGHSWLEDKCCSWSAKTCYCLE